MRYSYITTKTTYNETVVDRKQNYIEHYHTTNISQLTEEQISQLTPEIHIWKTGDRYFKLANKYYGDIKYWWIIAYFNKKPTEAHLSVGDKLLIPLPFEKIIKMIRVE
jgi:hypothetical protein